MGCKDECAVRYCGEKDVYTVLTLLGELIYKNRLSDLKLVVWRDLDSEVQSQKFYWESMTIALVSISYGCHSKVPTGWLQTAENCSLQGLETKVLKPEIKVAEEPHSPPRLSGVILPCLVVASGDCWRTLVPLGAWG